MEEEEEREEEIWDYTVLPAIRYSEHTPP